MISYSIQNIVFGWFVVFEDISLHVIESIEWTLRSLPNNEVHKEYLKEKVGWDW